MDRNFISIKTAHKTPEKLSVDKSFFFPSSRDLVANLFFCFTGGNSEKQCKGRGLPNKTQKSLALTKSSVTSSLSVLIKWEAIE